MTREEIINSIHNICFEMMDSINAEEVSFHDDLVLQINKKICEEVDKRWDNITVKTLEQEPKTVRRLTNSEWIDFLTEQFDISRTSAKEMLHVMMSVKKEDNFKKQFSQGRK